MKTIYVITGATGFVGCTLCNMLCRQGQEVRILLRNPAQNRNVPGAKAYPGNILDPGSFDALFEADEDAEFIMIHAAAIISVNRNDPECYQNNLCGTANAIEACKRHNVKRLVYLSSVDALYNPNDKKEIPEPDNFNNECNESSYARSKRDASQLVLQAANDGLDAVICLPSAVIGPGDYKGGFISTMLKMYIKGIPPVAITGGYDFVDVRDLAEGLCKAAVEAKSGSIYTFSGHYISIRNLFDLAAQHLGRTQTKLTLPTQLLYPFLPFISLFFKIIKTRPPLSADALALLLSEAKFSHRRAEKDLGYVPRPFKNTLEDTLDFLMEQEQIKKERQK